MDRHRITRSQAGIELTDHGDRLVLSSDRRLTGLASGSFADPAVSVELDLGLTSDAEFLGFAFTQFAMPVVARAGREFDFAPAPNLRSPAVVLPLLVRDGARCLLLAPLVGHHEQVISVSDGHVRWGWHGDLDEVPAGFETVLGVYEGPAPTVLFEAWANELRTAVGVERRPRSANPLTATVSYWTDNGAAYWYRTEPGETIAESVVAAVHRLISDGVPIGAVELDSWFYRHEVPRAIAAIGYPEEVPPTGLVEWRPRPDAYPADWSSDPTSDALEEMSRRLGGLPLTLHARHISPRSPYVEADWWVDRRGAQPSDPSFFQRWFDDAARWGATCIEQDWMLLYWFGVREMRRIPGRAVAWQQALDLHAAATGVDLLWCMATPADLIAAVGLPHVIAVRTSDDYRFTEDPALLWTWFLTVNRLVAPLGLWPFKDCFFSHPEPEAGDPISGDRHAEVEALLSAMSGGPVGIGDRIGRTDREIVMRTCDDAGRLLQPDIPIALIDDCLFGSPARGERLAWSTASTTIDHQTWTYVVALNTTTDRVIVSDHLSLSEIGVAAHAGVDGSVRHVYDWRTGEGSLTDVIACTLAPRDWGLWVICPPGSTDVGNTDKYVTVPSRQ